MTGWERRELQSLGLQLQVKEMATADKKSLFVGGGNGGPVSPTGNPVTDLERAQDVARRYRCEFIDLSGFELHHELFKKIPVELMFRYNFVPLEETADGKLIVRAHV